MKTTVNGVEITPAIAEVLSSWYETDDETKPEVYAGWLSEIQDCLTCILLDTCKVDNNQIQNCLGNVIYLKDELRCFIPESSDKQQTKN